MGNLLITMIGIVFCALLLVAGANYIKPTAYIEHNQADTNAAQIEALITDYNKLAMTVGHRPSDADYTAVFGAQSANNAYINNGGTVYVDSKMQGMAANSSNMAANRWKYIPSCGSSGAQDCFCLTVTSPTDVTYKATQLAALYQMDSLTASRVELSTSQCDDTSGAIVNPSNWPTATPINYYLTVRLNAAGTSSSSSSSSSGSSGAAGYTCSAIDPVYGSCPTTCGASTEPVTGWVCSCSDGITRTESYCTPPGGLSCSDYSGCSYSPVNVSYGSCAAACGTSTEPLSSWQCERSDGTIVANSFCTPPAATQSCTSTSTCTYTATPTYGACAPACGASTEPLSSYICTRSDGTVVANSFCTAPPATQACTSTATCQNGTCGSAPNTCAIGSPYGSSDNGTTTTWYCSSPNGGNSSGQCSAADPINGACGTSKDTCTTGTLTGASDNGTTSTWSCAGSNGGSTASCSAADQYPECGNCGGACLIGTSSQDTSNQTCYTGDVPADSYCVTLETWLCTVGGNSTNCSCQGVAEADQ